MLKDLSKGAIFCICLIFCIAPIQAQTVAKDSEFKFDTVGSNLPSDGILRSHAGEFQFATPLVTELSPRDKTTDHSEEASHEASRRQIRPDINRIVFRKHRWDFSIEGARFHNNIPFVFDFLLGDGYNTTGLDYTLVPFIASFRWQLTGIHGYKMFRGTWEASFSGAYTMIPRGPETRYFAYMMGIRRNFVQPNWRVIPYTEFRAGMGNINAKQPLGVPYAQGQDFDFTLFMDSGFRYNVNGRYALFFGAGYMHISNLYLSEPRYWDYGINVYGPMLGIEMRVGHHRDETVH